MGLSDGNKAFADNTNSRWILLSSNYVRPVKNAAGYHLGSLLPLTTDGAQCYLIANILDIIIILTCSQFFINWFYASKFIKYIYLEGLLGR